MGISHSIYNTRTDLYRIALELGIGQRKHHTDIVQLRRSCIVHGSCAIQFEWNILRFLCIWQRQTLPLHQPFPLDAPSTLSGLKKLRNRLSKGLPLIKSKSHLYHVLQWYMKWKIFYFNAGLETSFAVSESSLAVTTFLKLGEWTVHEQIIEKRRFLNRLS